MKAVGLNEHLCMRTIVLSFLPLMQGILALVWI